MRQGKSALGRGNVGVERSRGATPELELRAASDRYLRQEAALVALTRACALRRAGVADLMGQVAQAAAETLDVERVGIWRHDRARAAVVCLEYFRRTDGSRSRGAAIPVLACQGFMRALESGEVIAATDSCRDPRLAELADMHLRPNGITSTLDSPFHVSGGVAGVICAEHVGRPRRWTADEELFLVAVANLVSLLLAEEERREIEEQLRQSQKMDAIGQLAGGVAHDFNNILAAMIMQAEMNLGVAGLPDEVRDGLREIRAAGARAADLTRQLLLFGRRQPMRPRVLDLNDVVTELARMLQRIIGEDVRLQLVLNPRPARTRADSGMIEQVLMNLAVNARDAMPGGGRLSIETAERTLDEAQVRLHPDAAPGRYVSVTVGDTGAGIAPDVLPRIFEPFFTTKVRGKGTGLGLATVFGIVRQHRGWVTVASAEGKGTSFEVFLPAAEAGAEDEPSDEEPLVRGGNEMVLVAEDEPAVRRLTRTVLERHGYRVLEAANGEEAIGLWREHGRSVDLLLTDLVMPAGVSGRELASRLRAERPGLKVIYFSGYSDEIGGRELVLDGGERFLQKPFAASVLLETVRGCLD